MKLYHLVETEPKCSMKKCVFSIVLNSSVDFALRTAVGMLFHRNGDKLRKARWPYLFFGMAGRNRKFSLDERRLRLGSYLTIIDESVSGAILFNILYVNSKILKSER